MEEQLLGTFVMWYTSASLWDKFLLVISPAFLGIPLFFFDSRYQWKNLLWSLIVGILWVLFVIEGTISMLLFLFFLLTKAMLLAEIVVFLGLPLAFLYCYFLISEYKYFEKAGEIVWKASKGWSFPAPKKHD